MTYVRDFRLTFPDKKESLGLERLNIFNSLTISSYVVRRSKLKMPHTHYKSHFLAFSPKTKKKRKFWSVLVLYEIVRVDPIYGPAWIMTFQLQRRLHLSFGKITVWISITCYHLWCATIWISITYYHLRYTTIWISITCSSSMYNYLNINSMLQYLINNYQKPITHKCLWYVSIS